MSASAREPESPRPVSDDPSDGSPKGDAHRGDAASRISSPGPTHDTAKTPRQEQPRQDPTRQNLNSPPAGARTEAPEPPWKHKRPPRAFAGDVAMAELRNDLADVPDDMSEPPAPGPPISNRWLVGAKALIVVATAV